MDIDNWMKLLQAIKQGRLNHIHHSFPNPMIYGMRIDDDGVHMLIKNIGSDYMLSLDSLSVRVTYKDCKGLDIAYTPARKVYQKLYPSEEDEKKNTNKKKTKNVKKLFKKRSVTNVKR